MKIEKITQAMTKKSDGSLVVPVRLADGTEHAMHLSAGVVEDLMVALVASPQKNEDGTPRPMMPTPADGVAVFGGPNRPSGLSFLFANRTWVLPFTIQPAGLLQLKHNVDKLVQLVSGAPERRH